MSKDWLKVNTIITSDHPACSPDLNPIEHVWSYVERELRLKSESYKTPEQLWLAIEKEWYRIPQSYIDKLYWSMCNRIKEVIKAKGDITKY